MFDGLVTVVLLLLLLVAGFGVAVGGTGVAVGGTGVVVGALIVGTGVAVVGAVAVAVAGVVVEVAPVVAPASELLFAVAAVVAGTVVELELLLLAVVAGAVAVAVSPGETLVEVTTGAGFEFSWLATSSPQAPSEAAMANVTNPFPKNELPLELFFRGLLGFSPVSINFDISFPFFYRAPRITTAPGDCADWKFLPVPGSFPYFWSKLLLFLKFALFQYKPVRQTPCGNLLRAGFSYFKLQNLSGNWK